MSFMQIPTTCPEKERPLVVLGCWNAYTEEREEEAKFGFKYHDDLSWLNLDSDHVVCFVN
ncbi:hypothetical protein ACLOJK_032781 [Asimina triloba]